MGIVRAIEIVYLEENKLSLKYMSTSTVHTGP